MRKIHSGFVNSYMRYGHLKIPKSVQCECPECQEITEFTINANFQNSKTGMITECSCPCCKKSAVFIIMPKESTSGQEEHADMYLYDLKASKHTINQLENLPNIPNDLVRAYRSAINVHQSKEKSATAVMSKRVIESILKHFLGEENKKQSISQQLEELPNHIDLANPILTLSQLLAANETLLRMLELETEMDYETSTLVMDLLENLIDYLFILPRKIEMTQAKIVNATRRT